MKNFAAILLLLSAGGGAIAQDAQPYAGMQTREIKALSTEQVADLKAGRGMGLALAAELNGMPGPSHVLEMGEKLGLTQDQRARVQRLFDGMKSEAMPIGEKLLSQEAGLDREFATRRVTPASLKKATAKIGATQGELRNAHLKYHLAMLRSLTPVKSSSTLSCVVTPIRGSRINTGLIKLSGNLAGTSLEGSELSGSLELQ